MNEYAFSGRIVYQRTHTVPIDNGYLRRTVVYIDVGRPDRGEPSDAPLVLEGKHFHLSTSDGVPSWKRKRQAAATNRHVQLEARVVDHIKRHGLSSMRALCEAAGVSRSAMHNHLRERLGTVYCSIGNRNKRMPWKWGLVGVDYE